VLRLILDANIDTLSFLVVFSYLKKNNFLSLHLVRFESDMSRQKFQMKGSKKKSSNEKNSKEGGGKEKKKIFFEIISLYSEKKKNS
jgi:hypothetical protein